MNFSDGEKITVSISDNWNAENPFTATHYFQPCVKVNINILTHKY